jgi:hypothetical protein
MVKTKKKNGTVSQEDNRQRLKRLIRRMVSAEFSAPLKAALYRSETSPEYRRSE